MLAQFHNERKSVGTYARSFSSIFAGGLGLFLGSSVTRLRFEEWLEQKKVEAILGMENDETFEFTFCFTHYGPNSVEVAEAIYWSVTHLLAMPAILFSDLTVNFVGSHQPALDLWSEFELSQFFTIHFCIAFYLLLGYVVHWKTH